ncbi:MAG: glycosyltransferase family 2 protein [Oscillospiraceae bacterium]|nr:glycosyltransferase family 2 protein [Oscillospiraceae bacterium]
MKKTFSIIIPIYKNEKNLPVTVPHIIESIPTLFPEYNVELIMVNDGSPDNSWEIMKKYQAEYPETIRIASFTRNFGQTAAVYYGLSIAKGDVMGVISADLQDPFELFAQMLRRYEEGSRLVCAVRESRNEKGLGVLFSKTTHKMIRKFINPQYPIGGFDFYLMDSYVRDQLLSVSEKNCQPQISLLWLGVPTSFVGYTRQKRDLGKSGWTLSKKIKLFIDIFTTYSYMPLRVMSAVGCVSAIIAFIYGAFLVIRGLVAPITVPGWTTLVVLLILFSGLILLSLGILGEYLWRIFDEVKKKPMYLVRKDDTDIKSGE